VSQLWIDEMLRPHATVFPVAGGPQYGYLWWLQPVDDGVVRSYQARGNGGQYIMVVPAADLVVAFTGHAFNDPRQMIPFDLMKRFLIPMAMKAPPRQTPGLR
jgi:CubicO group peptidase (beta-lactamase class C family)